MIKPQSKAQPKWTDVKAKLASFDRAGLLGLVQDLYAAHPDNRTFQLKPHKVRYYVERRDPEFDQKMAAVLHVYKEVEILNQGLVTGAIREPGTVTVSYDEKPGIQALGVTAPDRPPVPGLHASHMRDYEYKRLGTVSLLAGLDLHSGKVTEIVNNTHKSSDFIEFLNRLDDTYPATQTLRLILDNHPAHISRETQRYLATRPQRFQFVFIPKHGSWLNLVENLFSKMARTMLREIRVSTKQELINRTHLYFQEVNATPVVFRWKYKMDEVDVPSTSSRKSLNECKTSEPPCAACGLLDSAENPHAAHGGSEVLSSNSYLRDFLDDVLVN
jgi:transposase